MGNKRKLKDQGDRTDSDSKRRAHCLARNIKTEHPVADPPTPCRLLSGELKQSNLGVQSPPVTRSSQDIAASNLQQQSG